MIKFSFSNFSFLGNAASIVFAYFFVNTLLFNAVDDFWGKTIIVGVITTSALTIFELLKRFLFKQTTVNILNSKKITNEIVVTLLLSVLLIVSSFFLSLNGAKSLANKSKNIDAKVDNTIIIKTDSITKLYNARIGKSDTDKQTYMKMVTGITKNPKLITQYNNLIQKSDENIKELEKEKQNKIKELESKITNKSLIEKSDVQSNITYFLIISSFIELIILIGVFFDSYYMFRTFKEFDYKVGENLNFKNYLLYLKIIEIAYNNGKTRKGDSFESFNKIKEIAKIQGMNVTDKTLKDFFIILKYLKISVTIGNKRIVEKNYEEAKEILVEYYKIK